ncbi:MAG: hypothetical protein ACXVDF_24530 [Ktedonobacterales bacterium]
MVYLLANGVGGEEGDAVGEADKWEAVGDEVFDADVACGEEVERGTEVLG